MEHTHAFSPVISGQLDDNPDLRFCTGDCGYVQVLVDGTWQSLGNLALNGFKLLEKFYAFDVESLFIAPTEWH